MWANQAQPGRHQNKENSEVFHLPSLSGIVRVHRHGEVLARAPGVYLRDLHGATEAVGENKGVSVTFREGGDDGVLGDFHGHVEVLGLKTEVAGDAAARG